MMKKYFDKLKIPRLQIDTMERSKLYVKSKDINKKIKNPTLEELSKYLNVEYDKNMAHAAEYDVERTYECYMKMLGRKIINNK